MSATRNPSLAELRQAMRQNWLADDRGVLEPLLPLADIGNDKREEARGYAMMLVARLRAEQQGKAGVDALLNEFSLSTEEGIALMCLAEALLRVPDALTADRLIRDKLQSGDWSSHLGQANSTFVNASAWALLFTGKLVNYSDDEQQALHHNLKRAAGRLGQPVIRTAVRRAMAIMGDVFVMGRTIEAAMERAERQERRGYRYSYDMLGEGARTARAAEKYFRSYQQAIWAIGEQHREKNPEAAAGISVKLSALHPRYESTQRERVMRELVPRLQALCLQAREFDIGLTVDAEEAARLDLSLDVIDAVFSAPELKGWSGFGVAVQAYQKRAPWVIDWLAGRAAAQQRRIMVRLVKGAYWDTEIKHAQVEGLAGYPVYSRKPATDLCYQACARKLLGHRPHLYPQFATHNAWSVAAILAMDESRQGYEFQRLHGMGEALYEQVMKDHRIPCRIYAPVGQHEDLLAYLVRRLLENGANSSFVNNIVDDHVPIESLVQDPVQLVAGWQSFHNPAIPLPAALYGSERMNSAGLELCDDPAVSALQQEMAKVAGEQQHPGAGEPVLNPAQTNQQIGSVAWDTPEQMRDKLAQAQQALEASPAWTTAERGAFLLQLADGLEAERAVFISLCTHEAGKTLADGVAEVREAVDFCRYYAHQLESIPAGEPLGVVLCISPWNFPLAIFLGQVAAALAAGNAVLAKPAEQTSLIALEAQRLMRDCGLPTGWLQCVTGPGALAGETLVPDQRVRGVLFTGSTRTGRWLFDTLAQRADAPVPLVAETGGQNAMIVDSTALPEQVVDDVIRSGFQSAGQRCSALRVLFLQEDVAETLISMIEGAMNELRIGDPARLDTDVGPVIDAAALQRLQAHQRRMAETPGVVLHHQLALGAEHAAGHFFAPCLYEIPSLKVLEQEVFGPVVHVIRYAASELKQVIAQINASGFGLTLGIHTRVQRTADTIAAGAQVGNAYVNRDMIGAVVGVQPFGGHGLSGTGPKAGGPLYLPNLQRPTAADIATPQAGEVAQLLPGPTGERNLYLHQPRGLVHACYGETDPLEHCLGSIDAILATGNRLWLQVPATWHEAIEARRQHWLPQGLKAEALEIAEVDAVPEPQAIRTLVVAPGSTVLAKLLPRLIGLAGPLPRIVQRELGAGYAESFVDEKVITTNTTAAGGNASLMTSG